MEIDQSRPFGGVDGIGYGNSAEPHQPGRRGRRGLDPEARVAGDPWDWEAWQTVLSEAHGRPFQQAFVTYEKFLDQFPTYARGWKQFAEHAVRHSREVARSGRGGEEGGGEVEDPEIAEELKPEAIYVRALKYCKTNVELWRSYISHVLKSRKNGSREEIPKIFEQAVNGCGLEPSSHNIWHDYIDFVARTQPSNPAEEQQRRDSLRKIYQRAVKSPIQNLENFWKQYEEFENEGMNPELARGILTELAPSNKSARAEFRARKYRRDGLTLNAPACPPRGKLKEEEQVAQRARPLPSGDHLVLLANSYTALTASHANSNPKQSKLWKKYISAEGSNAHELDAEELYRRVSYAHELALVCLCRYPDAWIEAAYYQIGSGKPLEAESLLLRGLELLPTSPLLHFALADLYELSERNADAKATYEALLTRASSPLAYVQYMRFCRRAEGVASARQVFALARKDKHCCTFQVFVAAANLEFYTNKSAKVARNVYELGLKLFPTSVDYALEYIDFLWKLNDDAVLRLLFERVLEQLPKGIDSRPIWDRYVAFECTFGNAFTTDEVVKRRSAAVSNMSSRGDEVLSLIARTTSMDLIPVTYQEMNAIRARSTVATAVGGKGDPGERSGSGGGGKESKSRGDTRDGDRDRDRDRGRGRDRDRDRGGERDRDRDRGGERDAAANTEPLGFQKGIELLGQMFPKPPHEPAPPVQFVMDSILRTPATFAETPLGMKEGGRGSGGSTRKRKVDVPDNGGAAGKDDALGGAVPAPVHKPPARDLFRSRHAQKLAKTK